MKDWQLRKIKFFMLGYTQNVIKNFFPDILECEEIDKEHLPKKKPYFRLQWWYYEEYNKIYIHFEVIDKGKVGPEDIPDPLHDYIGLYQEINRIMLRDFYKDLWIWPEIIGPSVNHYLYTTEGDAPFVDETMRITANTFTWWPMFDNEAFYFINDQQANIQAFAPFAKRAEIEHAFGRERIEALLEISNRYYEIWKNDPEEYRRVFPNYFEEYRQNYIDFFGKSIFNMDEYASDHQNAGIHYEYLSMVFPEPPKPE